MRQTFYDSVEAMSAAADEQAKKGIDAYYALASFKGNSRSADNALYLRSFFLDLDCGVGKPYVDRAAASKALRAFVDEAELPRPCIVNSGGGLHVYWPLTEDVPVEQWLPLARSLKRLCAQHGLFADPAVTADAARILRVPGTKNFKQDVERDVQVVLLSKPVSIEHFASCLPPAPVDLSAAKQFGSDSTTKDLAGGEYPKCEFRKIAILSLKGNGCAQMAHALQNAASLEEPLWRAALSIASRCEDRDKAMRKVSEGHPGYSPEATESKAAETKGPYTCEWYRLNHGARCTGCKQQVTTPLLLGRFVEEAKPTNEDGSFVVEAPLAPIKPPAPAAVALTIPALDRPYFRGANGGVYRKESGPDGEAIDVEIYPHDLYVTERFYDMTDSGDGLGEMVAIVAHLPADGVRRFSLEVASIMSKDKLRDELNKHGVFVYGKQVDIIMAYFASSIRKLQSQFSASKTRNQMGWTPDKLGFVVGEVEYTATGTKIAPPTSGTRQMAEHFTPHGSLEEWRSIVNFYNRPGLEPHALTLFFGFGSPLLSVLNSPAVRGAQVHLKHNGSGSGKSTVQMVVNSIFGHPDKLLMKKEDTFVSKMHILGMMNSMAFTVDEITNEKPEALSDYAYSFTSGRGKHRMEAQSNKLRSNTTTWCNITITSGNASVVDALQQLKSTADGELRRILEIAVPKYTEASKNEIDEVFGRLPYNYGLAGPKFIQYVLANQPKVEAELRAMQARLDRDLELDQADRFYSAILTCAFVGAKIAHELGLHDIDVARVYRYALGVVMDSRTANRSEMGSSAEVALETLALFINENVNNTVVVNHKQVAGAPERPSMLPHGALRVRYQPDTNELFITAADFRNYFTSRQVDVRESLQALTKAGIVKHNGKSHPVRMTAGIIGAFKGAAVRCYCFDGTALGVSADMFLTDDDAGGGA